MIRQLNIIAGGILLGASLGASADADLDRLRKDISVMEKILMTDFESANHSFKGIGIRGNYLAEQGAVFTVSVPRGFAIVNIDTDIDEHFFIDSAAPVAPIAPEFDVSVVREILSEVQGFATELHFSEGPAVDRELRRATRDLMQRSREIERDMANAQIEAIHAEDSRKQELETRLERLESQRETIEEKRMELGAQIETSVEVAKEKRQQQKEAREAERAEQLQAMEQTVLQTLCDYGSTLQNLPDKEHVSLQIQQSSNYPQTVLVFDKKEVTDCKPGSNSLPDRATRYLF